LKTAFLSLGSNLGDRQALLNEALSRLESAGVHVARRSRIHETEPQDYLDQPKFLNMAAEVETDLSPRELLAVIQKIETELGRQRTIPKGPRTIDIDILFYANLIVATPELEIPHPRLAERRFVLDPLSEIAPDFRHPITGQSVREARAALNEKRAPTRNATPPPDPPA
jgi:2-amino-4-hydroxy-6-hydroxymethyldihydropteridine diphosphokinase